MSATEQVNVEQTVEEVTEQVEQLDLDQKTNELLDITSMSMFKDAIGNDNLTVVDFHAKWCGPCRKIAPVYKKMCEEFTDVSFCKANVDVVRDVARDCNINCMPTFILFKGGEEVSRLKGANMPKLRTLVESNA